MATRSGSRALVSSMVASRRSGLKRPEPTCMSEIWTMRTLSVLLLCIPGHYVASRDERKAPSREAATKDLAVCVQEPPGGCELQLDGPGSGRARALLVGHAPLGCQQLARQLRERRVGRRELLPRHLLQRYPELLAPPDEPTHRPVRLAERHAPRRQEVRELRRERESTGGLRHPLAVEAGRAEHLGQHGEHKENGVYRVEERLFVLLQVLGVAERKPFE